MKKIILSLAVLSLVSCTKEEVLTPEVIEVVSENNPIYLSVVEGYYKNPPSDIWQSMISEVIKEDGDIILKTPYEVFRYKYKNNFYIDDNGNGLEFVNNETILLHWHHGASSYIYKQD